MSSKDLEVIQNSIAGAVAAAAASAAAAAASAVSASVAAQTPAKLSTLNATTGDLPAGAITGADRVTLVSSNATPGAQACRSAAAMIADASVTPPYAYNLRIVNTGAGTFTLAADGGATVTLSGTATVLQNTWRDFIVSFPTGSTCTITTVGTGTYS